MTTVGSGGSATTKVAGIVAFGVVGLVACGGSPSDAARPEAPGRDDVDIDEAALADAERTLGLGPEAPSPAVTSGGAGPIAEAGEPPNPGVRPPSVAGPPHASPPTCETACSALASMVRAAGRICSMSPGDRCSRAEARVERARVHVESSCGSCS